MPSTAELFADIPAVDLPPDNSQALGTMFQDVPYLSMKGDPNYGAMGRSAPTFLPTAAPELAAPMVDALHLDNSGQTFQDAIDALRHPLTLDRQSNPPGFIAQAGTGIVNDLNAMTGNVVTDPMAQIALLTGSGIGRAALGPVAPLVNRAMQGLFGGQAALGAPEMARQSGTVLGSDAPISEKAGAVAKNVANAIMIGGLGKGALEGSVRNIRSGVEAIKAKIKSWSEWDQTYPEEAPAQPQTPPNQSPQPEPPTGPTPATEPPPTPPAIEPPSPGKASLFKVGIMRWFKNQGVGFDQADGFSNWVEQNFPTGPTLTDPLKVGMAGEIFGKFSKADFNDPAVQGQIRAEFVDRIAKMQPPPEAPSAPVSPPPASPAPQPAPVAPKPTPQPEPAGFPLPDVVKAKLEAARLADQAPVPPPVPTPLPVKPIEQPAAVEAKPVETTPVEPVTPGGYRKRGLPSAIKMRQDEPGGSLANYDEQSKAEWLGGKSSPDGKVTLYRATPAGEPISAGDYVTNDRSYAQGHIKANLGGKGKITSINATLDDIYPADGPKEFWYAPKGIEKPVAPQPVVVPEPTAMKPVAKEAWQMTKEEWASATREKLAAGNAQLKAQGFSGETTPNMDAHYWTVKNALDKGKPVPDSVLADYPDLKPVGAENAQTAVEGPKSVLIRKERESWIKSLQGELKDIAQQRKELRKEFKGQKPISTMNRTTPEIERGQRFQAGLDDLSVRESQVQDHLKKLIYESKQSLPTVPEDTGVSPGMRSVASTRDGTGIRPADQQPSQGNVAERIADTGGNSALRRAVGEAPKESSVTPPAAEAPAKPVVKDSLPPEPPAKPVSDMTKEQALAAIDANDTKMAQLSRKMVDAKSDKKKAEIKAQIEAIAQESDALAGQHDLTFKTPPTEAPAAAPVEAPSVKSATEEMTPPEKVRMSKRAKSKRETLADLKARLDKNPLGDESGFVNTSIFRSIIDYGQSVFRKGMDFARWAGRMAQSFGNRLTQGHLKAIWDSMNGIAEGILRRYRNAMDFITIDPLPKIARQSEGALMRGIEHAYARVFVPRYVRSLLSEVFPDQYKNPQAMSRTMDILNKDDILGGYDEFVNRSIEAAKVGDNAGAKKWKEMADSVGSAHDLAQIDRDVRAAMADPEISANIERWKKTVQPEADRLYNEIKGMDPTTPREGRGRHFDTRVNLLPESEEARWIDAMTDEGQPMPATTASNYRNPNAKRDKFDRAAKFTGSYSTNPAAILANMLTGRWNEATKLRFYNALVDGGIGIWHEANMAPPDIILGDGVSRLPLKVPETNDAGVTRQVERAMYVPQSMVAEIRGALGTDMPITQNPVAKILTQIQLAQLADAVSHTKNLHSVLASAQGTQSLFTDLAKKMPGFSTLDATYRIIDVLSEISRDTPEIRKEISDMARWGGIRAHYPATGVSKITKMQDMIHAVDMASRITMNRFFDNLVERGLIADNPVERRNYVQQIGEYNRRLMGPIMRAAGQVGVSPFIVAGRNFNRFGRRVLTGSPGIKGKDWQSSAQMRMVNLATLASIFILPAMINYLITGKKEGRNGTPLGAIDLGGAENEKGAHKVLDLAQLYGVRRGMRSTGVESITQGLRNGDTADEIVGRAIMDSFRTASHPWTGPALGAVVSATTGMRFDLRGGPMPAEARKMGTPSSMSQLSENMRVMTKNQNALLYGTIGRPLWGDIEESYGKDLANDFLKSPASAVGIRSVKSPELSKANELASSTEARTPESIEKSRRKMKLAMQLKADPTFASKIDGMVRAGQLAKTDATDIRKRSELSPLQFTVEKNLTADEGMEVFRRATPENKDSIRKIIGLKVLNSLTTEEPQKANYVKTLYPNSVADGAMEYPLIKVAFGPSNNIRHFALTVPQLQTLRSMEHDRFETMRQKIESNPHWSQASKPEQESKIQSVHAIADQQAKLEFWRKFNGILKMLPK